MARSVLVMGSVLATLAATLLGCAGGDDAPIDTTDMDHWLLPIAG